MRRYFILHVLFYPNIFFILIKINSLSTPLAAVGVIIFFSSSFSCYKRTISFCGTILAVYKDNCCREIPVLRFFPDPGEYGPVSSRVIYGICNNASERTWFRSSQYSSSRSSLKYRLLRSDGRPASPSRMAGYDREGIMPLLFFCPPQIGP